MRPLLRALGQLDEVLDSDGRVGLERRTVILPSVVVNTAYVPAASAMYSPENF